MKRESPSFAKIIGLKYSLRLKLARMIRQYNFWSATSAFCVPIKEPEGYLTIWMNLGIKFSKSPSLLIFEATVPSPSVFFVSSGDYFSESDTSASQLVLHSLGCTSEIPVLCASMKSTFTLRQFLPVATSF